MNRFRAIRTAGCLAAVAVVAVAMLVGPIAGASASDTSIKKTIKSYNGKILVSEGHFVTALGEYKTSGNPAAAQTAITEAISVLRSLRAKIASESARAPKVKAGKVKVEKGLHALIVAYEGLKTSLGEKAASPEAAKADAEQAIATIKKAKKELVEGAKLLK